jgi:hypothetical protein
MRYKSGQRRRNYKWLFISGGIVVAVALVTLGAFGSRLSSSKKVTKTNDIVLTKAVQGVQVVANPPAKQPAHTGLELSVEPSLRKLAEYEKAYGGAVAGQLMVFARLPANSQDAEGDAMDMATKLQEFAKFHIQPLVIMEPTINGSSIHVADFAAGKYDASLTQYFQNLKAHGVTDVMMGTWVHFPEDNIPEWGNTDPGMFQANVVKAARIQKGVFPGSQVSILLNAQSFRSDDINRDYGTFSSLLPYVRGLPKDLFYSFGLQGFPWVSAASQKEQTKLLNPAQYMNANFAREAAKALGVKQIWFNTGTFGRMYTKNSTETVTYSPSQRQAILQGVLAQVKVAQRDGYKVSVNLFNFDGSNTGEATDWSYWHAGQTATQDPGHAVFKAFAEQLYASGGKLWLFDSD